MKIERLSLTHFRNINEISINFDKNVTVIIGNNGQGKTNILEAIHYLSTSRSFRVKDDQLCIQFNQTMSRIIGFFNVKDVKKQLKIILNTEGKYLFENNKTFTTNKDFIGIVNTVLFAPNDLFLFDGYPKNRRKMIDTELSKLFPDYVESLYSYNKLLKEKNLYLKQNVVDKDYVSVLDDQMIEQSLVILNHRYQFIDFLNKSLPKMYKNLVNEPNWNICVDLETVIKKEDLNIENLKKVYNDSSNKDILFKSSQIGIHKDDLIVNINNQDIIQLASQGQKRMMIIAIKLCLMHYIKEKIGEFPILLLDDVFSEIDEHKRKQFIHFLPETCQTIVTTTDISHVQLWDKGRYSVMSIVGGHIAKE